MHLEVLTPQKMAVSTEVDEVTVPGLSGEFGFLSALQAGTLAWRGKAGSGTLAIGPGYCEVDGKDRIVVLTSSAEKA
jgi:F-type H+-transporting ATPase subunit epsilon